MRRRRQETGVALIMVVGVITALAIMAAALTALTVNVMHNTARDRQQTKTFNVAEGTLDHALAQLASSWPTSEALKPTFVPKDFKDRYFADGLESQYADLDVQAWFYDNSNENPAIADPNEDPLLDRAINREDYNWDKNLDGQMYVEVQASNGDRTTLLRALVQRQTISLGLPQGVAFYTASTLWTHGGSTVIGIDAGYEPLDGIGVKGYVGDTSLNAYRNSGGSSYDPDVNLYVAGPTGPAIGNVHYGQRVPSLDDIMNTAMLDLLKGVASPNNYYTDDSKVSTRGFTRTNALDPESITPMPPDTSKDDLSGVVFVETTGLVQWQIRNQFNSPEHPGILVVKGASLKLTSGGDYYGIIYVDGGTTDLGNVTIHGALICGGGSGSELGGTQNVSYNDVVWRNLSGMNGAGGAVTVAAKLVPNSWRELHPPSSP